MYKAAVITVSDKCFHGQRHDTGGPLVAELLAGGGYEVAWTRTVPDEQSLIEDALRHGADTLRIPLIITTGGTGFSPRDVTPEATLAVCERLVPGIPEAMRAQTLAITSRAMLSRMAAGIRGQSLIINLPGSPKAIAENLAVVLPVMAHGLGVLVGEQGECART